jgi:hypothetical protein
MRMRKAFKKLGYFWLPSAAENKIPGTLTILDGGEIELEAVGLFGKIEESIKDKDNLIRIVGNIEDDGLVTLEECFYKNRTIAFGGISKSMIHVHKVLSGVSYAEGDPVFLNTFSFSVEGIDEWVGISGIKSATDIENRTATITYQEPEEISYQLDNGMKLLISYAWTLPGFQILKEAKITHRTFFKLTSTEKKELDEFMTAARKITYLLCFAIDETVCLENIVATSDDVKYDNGKGELRHAQIKIYYPSLPFSKEEPTINLHKMLFKFGQVRDNGGRVINNWFDAYDRISPALNLYFSTKTGGHKYLEEKFLALSQGLETYHRRTYDGKLMGDTEFKELVDGLLLQCPEERKEWLQRRLANANEISFGNRIKNVIKPFKEHVGTSKEREKLINNITNTRHYLTHYNEALKSQAAEGDDLWSLCIIMEAIFQLHLLQVLGFSKEEIDSILNSSYKLKQKFKEISN